MDDDENKRGESRLTPKVTNSFYFYTSAYNEQENINSKISQKIESTIVKLLDDDLKNKIEVFRTLNQMIKTHQKYIVMKISDEVINKVCLLTNIKAVECQSLQFLNNLIQFCPNLYQYLEKTDFYSNLIQQIQPDENAPFCRQILIFLTTTIKKVPESIQMMLHLDLLTNIKNIDQTQFAEQLRIIYSSSFIQLADFSILDSILFYLTFPKSEFVIETLKYVKNCISDAQILQKIWDNIYLDDRLISLLSNENYDVVSSTVSIFSMIFSISDETIKILFENKEIIITITNNLFNEDMNLNASIFDFLISLLNTASDESNIDNIFELIRCMEIDTKKLEHLNFINQQKLTHLVFDLLLKISCPQIALIFDPSLLRTMIHVSQTTEEDIWFCAQRLHLIMKKNSSNENLNKSILDLISEADLNDYVIEASNTYH